MLARREDREDRIKEEAGKESREEESERWAGRGNKAAGRVGAAAEEAGKDGRRRRREKGERSMAGSGGQETWKEGKIHTL